MPTGREAPVDPERDRFALTSYLAIRELLCGGCNKEEFFNTHLGSQGPLQNSFGQFFEQARSPR